MATLDDQNNSVVLRIAYAGPAMSGKTESVRALAVALVGKDRSDQKIYSPSEAQGRTMYFDWMDYTAGLFQGRQVRCQIIAVPGQASLAERRRLILESADTIIFVLDSSPGRMEESLQSFNEIRPWITLADDHSDNNELPPMGILIQANKRDLDDAVPLDIIKQRIDADNNMGFIETVATRGHGIREAFVIGVGMALDRTLEMMNKGLIKQGTPEIDNGEDLLQQMHEQEQKQTPKETPSTPATNILDITHSGSELGQLLHHMINPDEAPAERPPTEQSHELPKEVTWEMNSSTPEVNAAPAVNATPGPVVTEPATADAEIIDLYATDTHAITLPNTQVPAGLVWPPVTGRVLLNELNSVEQIFTREENGGWEIECSDGFRLRTETADQYPSLDGGRQQLLIQVNRHMKLQQSLSLRRCLALSECEDGSWRLWQIVDQKASLAEQLINALNGNEPETIASEIFHIAMTLLQAVVDFANQETPLRATLATTAYSSDRLVYTGFIPAPPPAAAKTRTWPFSRPPLKMVEEEFRPAIAAALARGAIDVPMVLRSLERQALADQKGHNLTEMLSFLLLGH